jgi:hypothetical protein
MQTDFKTYPASKTASRAIAVQKGQNLSAETLIGTKSKALKGEKSQST